MLSWIKYFLESMNMPTKIGIILVCIFFVIQVVGEILEFKGKVVPEFIKIRKYFARKKTEKDALRKMPELINDYAETKECFSKMSVAIDEVKVFLDDVKTHYNKDNIKKRDTWMENVNNKFIAIDEKQAERDDLIAKLSEKLDKNNADTLSLLIDNKRNYILDFAERASDLNRLITREQYRRFFKVHQEYEEMIAENNITNGEVDIAYKMTVQSYEERLKKHAFFEDAHGYNV